jgi:hypothetical protein
MGRNRLTAIVLAAILLWLSALTFVTLRRLQVGRFLPVTLDAAHGGAVLLLDTRTGKYCSMSDTKAAASQVPAAEKKPPETAEEYMAELRSRLTVPRCDWK